MDGQTARERSGVLAGTEGASAAGLRSSHGVCGSGPPAKRGRRAASGSANVPTHRQLKLAKVASEGLTEEGSIFGIDERCGIGSDMATSVQETRK